MKIKVNGISVNAAAGTLLSDAIERAGVPLLTPCGGRGICGRCKVRIRENGAPEREVTACTCRLERELEVFIGADAQPVINKDIKLDGFKFAPGKGLGIAVDIGTTTVAAVLLDLKMGEVLES
ncbi:MAG: 2Fe-2S iron-sulfur cluster-binding protein, partial [Firmicutes bacterium]|nr:2Fe-2S iron-sulfur cluster-binding protein [Bacillota bacterium]